MSAALLLALFVGSSPARAYEEKATVSLDLGYARTLASEELPENGGMIGVSGTWGIGDAWMLGARLAYGVHPADRPLHVALGGAEAVYLLDILEWVPFFGAGTDAIVTANEGDIGVDWALHAVAGLDYLASRDWIVGLDLRAYVLPLRLADRGVDPVYFTVALRLSRVIELF